MDINTAVIRLKELEIVKSQIDHLQREAASTDSKTYAMACHDKAECLLLAFPQAEDHE